MNMQRVFAMGLRWVVVSLGMVMLSSCGGGGGGGAIPDANLTGYYTNTGTLPDLMVSDLEAMIYNNRIMLFSKAQGYGYDGTLTVSGNTITGNLVEFVFPGESIYDATLSATFNPADHSISGTLNHIGGIQNASFTLVFAAGRPASKVADIVKPDWTGSVYNAKTDPLIFTLADNMAGAATMTTTTRMATNADFKDCNFTGTLTPVAGSLFEVNMPLDGCPKPSVTGTYTGLAAKRGTSLVILATFNNTLIGNYAPFSEYQ